MAGKGRPPIEGQRITYIEPHAGDLEVWAAGDGISRAELLRRIVAAAVARRKT